MTISIYSANSEYIRINLLEIASNILKNYKVGEIYSINLKIDFDLLFITDGGDIRSHYYISSSGIINEGRYEYELTSETDSAGVTSEEYIKSESRGYSDQEFMNIINARLKRGLEKIGLKRIESFINGNSIATTCETSYSSKNEYKNFLLSYIENEINALHPIINIEEMRKGVLNTLLRLSELYESNSVILTNNDIILSANSKGNFRNDSEYDIVRIFEYYIPDSLLELISYLFLYEGDIESLTEINLGQYKIILSNEYNHSKSKIEGPIFFNEDTGDVWLEGSIIGNLPVGQNLYKFFRVLYESPNIAIPAGEVIERAGLAKSKSKEDGPYLGNELLSMGKKLGKDFIEVYIKRKANRFTLLNVKKAKETNLRPI